MGRQRPDTETITESIDSGTAELVPEVGSRRSWTLRVNGTPQSHVDLDDPTYLEFEYVRRLAHIVDLTAPSRVLHLGGGALTLARYVAESLPRASQQVAEIDAGLIAFIRRELPPPARVKITTGDARAVLAKARPGTFDLIVTDCFAGARTPAHLTSVEFVRQASAALADDGIYAANIGDGNGLAVRPRPVRHRARGVRTRLRPRRTRRVPRPPLRQLRDLRRRTPACPMQQLMRATAGDPFQGRVEHGTGLTKFIGGAPVTTDETATLSPAPPSGLWGT